MNTLGVALAAVFVSTLRSLLPWVTSRRWDSSSTSLRSLFRHVVHMSAYAYFGRRFGSGVRIYSSFAFAMGHFSKMGFVFYLLALTLSSMTGWAIDYVIVLTAIVTIFYTMIGGVEAIVWSDVLQGFVLWFGILV